MQQLLADNVTMADTSLGQRQDLMKWELSITAADMGDEEWNALVSKRQKLIECRKSPPSDSFTEEDDPSG